MNTMLNINPWSVLSELLDANSRAFKSMRARACGHFPPVNVFLDDDAIIVDLELPGKTAKDIELSLSAPYNVNICADENKFLACIINVIKNAIEAIDKKGEIKITEEIIGNKVSIKISNNGKPIEKDVDIFKEGYTTKSSGNGLGLPICKKNIEAQNGILTLSKSTENITEFEIIMPINKN